MRFFKYLLFSISRLFKYSKKKKIEENNNTLKTVTIDSIWVGNYHNKYYKAPAHPWDICERIRILEIKEHIDKTIWVKAKVINEFNEEVKVIFLRTDYLFKYFNKIN